MEAHRILAAGYAARFPAEAARRLEAAGSGAAGRFLAEIEPETAVAVVEHLFPSVAAAAFETMGNAALAPILEHLPVRRSVLVMRSVTRDRRAAMLGLLPARTAATVERLASSPEGTAGEVAEPVAAVLLPEMSVEEARRVLEKTGRSTAYVVDAEHRLVGVTHRRVLSESDQRARVENLMSRPVVRLPSSASIATIRKHPAWTEFERLPVVDHNGVLIGIIRHRTIRRSARRLAAAPAWPRGALATFLDLGELYWGALASVVATSSGRRTPGASEVKHGA